VEERIRYILIVFTILEKTWNSWWFLTNSSSLCG